MTKGEKRNYFDFPTGALVAIAAFVMMLLWNAIVSALPISETAATWTGVIGNQVMIVATCLVAAKLCGVRMVPIIGLCRRPKAYLLPFLILIAASCYAAFGPVAGMVSHLLDLAGAEAVQPEYAIPLENPGLFVLAFLALTIIPPIGEEMLFRGVLISGEKRKAPLFAILYSAMAFALFHGNPHQLVYQFFLGLIAAYLAVVTGGILAGAVVHGFSNALAILLSYFSYHEMIDKKFFNYFEGDGFYISWEILVGVFASVLLLIGLIALLTYLLKREREKTEEDDFFGEGILGEANAFLSYLAFSAKEREEIAEEKRTESSARKESFFETYRILLPLLLIVILALVVIFVAVLGDRA